MNNNKQGKKLKKIYFDTNILNYCPDNINLSNFIKNISISNSVVFSFIHILELCEGENEEKVKERILFIENLNKIWIKSQYDLIIQEFYGYIIDNKFGEIDIYFDDFLMSFERHKSNEYSFKSIIDNRTLLEFTEDILSKNNEKFKQFVGEYKDESIRLYQLLLEDTRKDCNYNVSKYSTISKGKEDEIINSWVEDVSNKYQIINNKIINSDKTVENKLIFRTYNSSKIFMRKIRDNMTAQMSPNSRKNKKKFASNFGDYWHLAGISYCDIFCTADKVLYEIALESRQLLNLNKPLFFKENEIDIFINALNKILIDE